VKRTTRVVLAFALAGTGVCVLAISHFIFTIVNNRLPWSAPFEIQAHYQAVGHSYSQGFMVGFFLCFSLAVAAVGLSSWWEQRRLAKKPAEAEGHRGLRLLS